MGYRRKHATDKNQPEIVEALRQLGAEVHVIDEPVDLLVGWRGHWVLIEIKNKGGLNKLTDKQEKFFSVDHKGPSAICHELQDVVNVLNKVVRRWKLNTVEVTS